MNAMRYFRIVLPAIIGNVLEWYEFSIYGYFAVDIAHQFFPRKDSASSLLEFFAVLAIGFIMRPVGSVVFGYLADRKGRQKILPITVFIMAGATALIGLIPSHQEIGIWASVLLVSCRVIQGFTVGGEYANAITYIIEQTPASRRGFFGSLTLFGAYSGILLGSIVAALLTWIAKGTPYFEYTWRAAFVLGIFLGAVGIYLRKKAPESPEFLRAKEEGKLRKNPLEALLFMHSKNVLFGAGMAILPAVSSWLILAFFPTYTTQYGKLFEYQTLSIETFTLFIIAAGIPIYGFLSDKVNRFPFLFASPILMFFLCSLLFRPLLGASLPHIFFAQAALALLYTMSEAVLPATLAAIFPVEQRCTAIALCINIANGFFGGTAPLIATYLIHATGNPLSPSWYLMAMALVSFISTWFIYKAHREITGAAF